MHSILIGGGDLTFESTPLAGLLKKMHHIRPNWNDDFNVGLWLIPVVTFSSEYNKIQTRIDSRLFRKDFISLIPGRE